MLRDWPGLFYNIIIITLKVKKHFLLVLVLAVVLLPLSPPAPWLVWSEPDRELGGEMRTNETLSVPGAAGECKAIF